MVSHRATNRAFLFFYSDMAALCFIGINRGSACKGRKFGALADR